MAINIDEERLQNLAAQLQSELYLAQGFTPKLLNALQADSCPSQYINDISHLKVRQHADVFMRNHLPALPYGYESGDYTTLDEVQRLYEANNLQVGFDEALPWYRKAWQDFSVKHLGLDPRIVSARRLRYWQYNVHYPVHPEEIETTEPTAQEAQAQRQLAIYPKDELDNVTPIDQEAVLNTHTPWYLNLGWMLLGNNKNKRERKRRERLQALRERIDHQVQAVYTSLLTRFKNGEKPSEQDLAYKYSLHALMSNDDNTEARNTLYAWSLAHYVHESKRNLWRTKLNTYLHILGVSTAILVSLLQGIITFFFANFVFGAPLHFALLLSTFAGSANLLTLWNDVPNTFIELINGKVFKGFNPQTNTSNQIFWKKFSLGLFLLPSAGAGVALGIATYVSFMFGAHPISHLHIFIALSAGHPAALAVSMAIIIGVAISCNIHRSFADFLKNDQDKALRKFFKYFWDPENTKTLTPQQVRLHRAKNILTLVLCIGAAAAAAWGTLTLVQSWHYAALYIQHMPIVANAIITLGLAGLSRIPFVAKGLVKICRLMTGIIFATPLFLKDIGNAIRFGVPLAWHKIQVWVRPKFNLKLQGHDQAAQNNRDQLREHISRSPQYAKAFKLIRDHPVFMIGIVGALFYIPFALLWSKASRQQLKQEAKRSFGVFLKHPWIAVGIVGAVASVVVNAAANFFIADPAECSVAGQAMSADVSFTICAQFAREAGEEYVTEVMGGETDSSSLNSIVKALDTERELVEMNNVIATEDKDPLLENTSSETSSSSGFFEPANAFHHEGIQKTVNAERGNFATRVLRSVFVA